MSKEEAQSILFEYLKYKLLFNDKSPMPRSVVIAKLTLTEDEEAEVYKLIQKEWDE